ncbi:MAG: glycoside hydrolase family 43 protein [Lachnospiraceae bacterium]|nr:glycoside hydrolase family 43 protein [Lachnospiraceae bacterium]
MKAKTKRFLALLLAGILTVAGTVMVVAATPTADDFKVVVSTDKDSYQEGEKVYLTIKVENEAENANVSKLDFTYDIPEDIKENIADYDKLPTSLNTIDEGITNVFDAKPATPGAGDSVSIMLYVGIMFVVAGIVIAIKTGGFKKVASLFMAVMMIVGLEGVSMISAQAASETVNVTGSKTIKYAGKDKELVVKVAITIDGEKETDSTDNNTGDNNTGDDTSSAIKHVTVHDPSIVKDPETGMYYVFGSHRAWAKSEDLINWTIFTNNINTDYETLFADAAEWSALGGSQKSTSGKYEVGGNLWAPDVIYNEDMGKWCMYMSVNGDYWYTSVVLLTADDLEGDWTVVGPVVYSGFTNKAEAEKTDFYDVYEGTDFPERYNQNRNGNHTYGMNAIDPCVFYDEDGKLWMVYGSWFGGLYMIELDTETGLRLASHKYETVDNVSDEYQGIKLAGGQHVSGEAPYIEYIDGYYYLYVTLGGLTANGGYNMRVFRSEDVDGPYVDISGDDARYTSARDNINYRIGNRVMSNYKWDYMDYGYVAQGHNSAFVDDDGKAYVIYHTRFNNQGEGHQVRVHQQFVNEDGWLVTAPFEYYNEKLTAVEKSDVVGAYSVLVHKLNVDYANKECVESINIMLKDDGTVSGELTGTWKFGTDGAPYVTMEIGDYTYKGVFVEQKMEESSTKTMTFTVIGNDEINIWGYKLAGDDEELAKEAADALTIPMGAMADLSLPTTGLNATTISWASAKTDIIANDGKITRPEADTVVKLTATITYGESSVKKDFDVKVFAEYDATKDKVIWTYAEDGIDLSSASAGKYQYPNPLNAANISGLNVDNGVSIKFHISAATSKGWTNNIISFNENANGGLWINDTSYLGYNADGFFDANLHNGSYKTGTWTAGTDFLTKECDVEVKLLPTGFEYYVDGELVYDNTDVPSDEIPGEMGTTAFTKVLTYLNKTATVMNFGWGGFWADAYKGTVSDVEISVLGAPEEDAKGNLFLEEFVTTTPILTEWPHHDNAADFLTAEYSDDHGYYLKWYATNGKGNRGCYYDFAEEYQLESNYTLEADIMLNSGGDRDTQLTIYGTDRNRIDVTGNKALESGYIFQMTVLSGTTNVNIAGANSTYTIPKDTWVHVKFVVNDEGKVSATIGDQSVILNVNGSGKLGGIFALAGRSKGMFCIDNITLNHASSEDLALLEP